MQVGHRQPTTDNEKTKDQRPTADDRRLLLNSESRDVRNFFRSQLSLPSTSVVELVGGGAGGGGRRGCAIGSVAARAAVVGRTRAGEAREERRHFKRHLVAG